MITAETSRATSHRRSLTSILILIAPFAAFALGWWAQRELDAKGQIPLAVLAFLLATLLLVVSTWNVNLERATARAAIGVETPLRLPLVALSFALAALAFVSTAPERFTPEGVIIWLLSIAMFVYALPHARDLNLLAHVRAMRPRAGVIVRWEILALALITIVAAFFRFYKLDAIPAEMGPDLPLKFFNVETILSGNPLVFFPSWPGREPLFFYWVAIFAEFFGNSHLTIKFAAALVGIGTLPVLFIVARRLFNAEVGLYASALLAVSHWHIILSRIGFRAILMPLFIFVLTYVLVRALDAPRDFNFALVGLWLGAGLYTYNAWMMAPLAFIVAFVLYWVARHDLRGSHLIRYALIAAVAALLVFIPLARFGYEHPEIYLRRVASRLTSQEQPLPPDLAGVFADNLIRTFGMFNYRGDSVFVQNVPFLRELGFGTAILFVLGCGYALARWRRGHNSIVLSFFVIMLLLSALALAFPVEAPNAVRASAGIGLAFLLAALPLPALRMKLNDWIQSARVNVFESGESKSSGVSARNGSLPVNFALAVFAVLLMLVEARAAFTTYFTDYSYAQPAHNYSISLELARALDDFAGNGSTFVKIWPYWYDGNALRAQMVKTPRDWRGELERFDPNAPPFSNFNGKALFLINPHDQQALDFLNQYFPNGIAVEHFDPSHTLQFISFYGQR